jgi:hypothetical protein
LRIKKAVITAAGQNQRALPLQTLIDRDHRAMMLISSVSGPMARRTSTSLEWWTAGVAKIVGREHLYA